MMVKGSKLYSVLHGVCPRCQEQKVFKYPAFKSLYFTDMHDHCKSCGQSFEPEPDFYQGAMYVSYALTTGVFVSLGILMLFVIELELWLTFTIIILVGFLLLPVFFRVSRIIWLNLFVNFNPLYTKKTR